jgi:hypothetical protein
MNEGFVQPGPRRGAAAERPAQADWYDLRAVGPLAMPTRQGEFWVLLVVLGRILSAHGERWIGNARATIALALDAILLRGETLVTRAPLLYSAICWMK